MSVFKYLTEDYGELQYRAIGWNADREKLANKKNKSELLPVHDIVKINNFRLGSLP